MTWNGHLGFQKEPSEDIYVPLPYPQLEGGPQGIMGKASSTMIFPFLVLDTDGF
jgi:hypothetical protein